MASEILYPCCIVCVALLVDLLVLCLACLTVCVNCLVKQYTIFLGVVVILLLNVKELLSVGGGSLLDTPCMVFQKCVCCGCDHSVRLDVSSIGSVCLCRKLSLI